MREALSLGHAAGRVAWAVVVLVGAVPGPEAHAARVSATQAAAKCGLSMIIIRTRSGDALHEGDPPPGKVAFMAGNPHIAPTLNL
jgi:hypothetical protein